MFRKLNPVVVLMTTSNSPLSTVTMYLAATVWQEFTKEFYRMKKLMMSALLAGLLACGGSALYAQMAEGSGQGGGAAHQMPSPENRLQHMTKMLNLTADQQEKIKPILDNESQQMQTLRQDTSMSREDKMTKMRGIRETSNTQINSILTTEQQQKWAQMRENHGGHGSMGAGGMQAPNSPAPSTPSAPPQQ